MRIVIQRVSSASVDCVGGMTRDGAALAPDATHRAEIARGVVALVGFEKSDTPAIEAWCAEKLAMLRIFEDGQGKLNLSVGDVQGSVLLVPNFTLAGDCATGRRPSFDGAMVPELAVRAFHRFAEAVEAHGVTVKTGVFRAYMQVSLVNDGPVTLIIERR